MTKQCIYLYRLLNLDFGSRTRSTPLIRSTTSGARPAVTGRLGAVSRRTPGMLSNVLPLRLTVHPKMSLSELIKQVAEHVRRGLLHQ